MGRNVYLAPPERGSMRGASSARRSRTRRGRGPRKRLLLPGALLAALAALALASSRYVGWGALLEGTLEVFGSPEALKGYVLGFGSWAPVVFFLAQVAQVIFAPLPGGATALVGILLFGPWVGITLNLAGGLVGSVVLFALTRRWGRPLAARLVGRKNFERYAGALGDDEKGALLLVVMLVPFVPDDVAVAIAGLSAVSFRRFVLVVALGRLPGSSITGLVAADLLGRSASTLVMVGLAAVVAAVLIFPRRKRLFLWLLRRAPTGQERKGGMKKHG